jgi:DNA invertase Pin-like site-specific DNA recombinase
MPPSIVNSIPPTTRAAQYVRMSTEHQHYSPQNQSDTITKYAIAHNMDIIVHTMTTGEAASTSRAGMGLVSF